MYLITPTWNCGAEFARCVASVVKHARSPVRWVVVENGSIPEEKQIVEQVLFRSDLDQVEVVAYIENDRNLGIPVAQNQALDWIAAQERDGYGVILMSADVEVSEGWLEHLLQFVDEHPETGIVSGCASPGGSALPVFHHPNGRWYVRHDMAAGGPYPGETVDFATVYLRPEIVARALRFDTGYEIYDGYDQDMCFRVRSWGYQVYATQAGVTHYGSAAMKKSGYRWHGGGRREWDALRAKNLARFVEIWGDFLAPKRKTIAQEVAHVMAMNEKLVAEAGHRKEAPKWT